MSDQLPPNIADFVRVISYIRTTRPDPVCTPARSPTLIFSFNLGPRLAVSSFRLLMLQRFTELTGETWTVEDVAETDSLRARYGILRLFLKRVRAAFAEPSVPVSVS